jgi:biopolymer transport protein ExbD
MLLKTYQATRAQLTMKIYLEPDDLDVRIELIPLIDVIFCILVFFILGAVTFGRAQSVGVDLPTAGIAQTEFDSTLNVVIDSFGQISIAEKGQKTPVTEEQLGQLLAVYVNKYPQGLVQLEADKVISYGQVIRVFDLLREVGGTRVSLAVDNPSPATQLPGSTPTVPGALQTQPNLTQPNLTQPGLNQPNLTQPNTTNPQPSSPVPQSGISPSSSGIPANSLFPQQPNGLPSSKNLAPAPGQPQ